MITPVDFSRLAGRLTGISDRLLRQHFQLYEGYVKQLNAIEAAYPMTDWTPLGVGQLESAPVSMLDAPVASLRLTIQGTLAECIQRVMDELRRAGIPFEPRWYLGDGDFWTADRSISINLPWYLANPSLWRLASKRAETTYTVDQVLRCLRHELAHAIGYAYELWQRPEWSATYGDFLTPYLDGYVPNDVVSEDFVEYLTGTPRHYAQKHPDEAWAEAAARLLDLNSADPFAEHAQHPGALRKLEVAADLLKSVRGQQPVNHAPGKIIPYRMLKGRVRDWLGAPSGTPTYAPAGWSEHSELLRREPHAYNAVVLHELYFGGLGGPGGRPPLAIEQEAIKGWGSLESYLRDLRAAAGAANGWALTVWDPRADRMRNCLVHEHADGVMAGCSVLLAIDTWEHAYAADYGTRKDIYLGAVMQNIAWDEVYGRLLAAGKSVGGIQISAVPTPMRVEPVKVEPKFEVRLVSSTKKRAGREGLVAISKRVKRSTGAEFEQTFWVRSEDAASVQGKKNVTTKELHNLEQKAIGPLHERIAELANNPEYLKKTLDNPEFMRYSDRGSTSETPDGGFPDGHPYRNPTMRANAAAAGWSALSYSNSVGLGAALRTQARHDQGLPPSPKDHNDLIKHFSKQCPPGVTLSDVNKAMHVETQGMLKKLGINELVLYRGTGHEGVEDRLTKSAPTKILDVSMDIHGFSSFSISDRAAGVFGRAVMSVRVPAERIMAFPGSFPKEISKGAAMFGGGRNELECIVMGSEPLIGTVYKRVK